MKTIASTRWEQRDVVLHNFLYPSLQQGLVRELREDLKKVTLVSSEGGTKLGQLGKWKRAREGEWESFAGCLFSDLLTTVWIEFFREMLWGRRMEDLPNYASVRIFPPTTEFARLPPGEKFDRKSLILSLGLDILVNCPSSFPATTLLSSGSALWINDPEKNSLRVVGFNELNREMPEGLSLAVGTTLLVTLQTRNASR